MLPDNKTKRQDTMADLMAQLEAIRRTQPDLWRHLVGLIREAAKAA